jgi:anaerobic ribonucleoside-triphosphate reductase activating protein
MRLSGITYESVVDGPGIRVVVFTQGCLHGCHECHNPETWDVNGGKEYTVREVIRMMKRPGPNRKQITGVTFSGGEPFLQAAELVPVAYEAHRIGWNVMTYTGYLYEDLRDNPDADVQALLKLTDYLKDGPYIHDQRDIGLKFRGSANQRLIDMNATRKREKVVLFY